LGLVNLICNFTRSPRYQP